MTPSKVKKLRSLWARRASSASLNVSEKAIRLLRKLRLPTAGRTGAPEEADEPPELLALSNLPTPKVGLRRTADTNQYEYEGPFVSRKCEGSSSFDAAGRIYFPLFRGLR